MTGFPLDRPSWAEVLRRHAPLQLPVAHDALTVKLIERAGFPACQIGGFAVDGTRYGYPDLDLTHFGEKHQAAAEIVSACRLPVLMDGDDDYGDAKNVTRTVQGYELIGVSAIFIEDQQPPKKCGHMVHKRVVPVEVMERKFRAAAGARQNPATFLLARTDAAEPEGIEEATGAWSATGRPARTGSTSRAPGASRSRRRWARRSRASR
jgi:2-methylisocitrate lyase-like PEP mutase family enzyme